MAEPYRDVDPTRPQTMAEMLIRDLVADRVEDLAKLMHYSDLVGDGEQWAVPIALDCGFSGSIVIRVDAIGDCERRPTTSPATHSTSSGQAGRH